MNVEWFASLPDGWSQRRIKTLTPVMRGASPRPIDDPIYFDDDGEYAWVRISDVSTSNGFLTSTTQRLSEIGAARSVKLEPGELFLSIAGSVGKQCITNVRACIHDGFVYFPYLPKESQKFLFWIFESKECFSGLGKLGTQLNLNTQTVGNISIPFPDLPTQRAIADFLDRETARIDTLIEKKQRLVELLGEREDKYIRGVLSGETTHALSRKSTNAPWLNAVPDHWNVIPLRHLVKIQTGGRDTKDRVDEGDYPFFVRSMTVERINTFTFDEEAVLTSGDGAGVGNVFHHINCKFDLHQRMYAFTEFRRVSGTYFYHFLRTFFKLQMTQWSAKSTVDSVRMPFLKTLLVTVPPEKEQSLMIKEVETRAVRDKAVKEKTNSSIDRLKEYRSALITSAVTGQIDVTKWTNAGTTDRQLDAIQEEFGA